MNILKQIEDSGIGFYEKRRVPKKQGGSTFEYKVFLRHDPDNITAQYHNVRVLQDALYAAKNVVQGSIIDDFDTISGLAVVTFKLIKP